MGRDNIEEYLILDTSIKLKKEIKSNLNSNLTIKSIESFIEEVFSVTKKPSIFFSQEFYGSILFILHENSHVNYSFQIKNFINNISSKVTIIILGHASSKMKSSLAEFESRVLLLELYPSILEEELFWLETLNTLFILMQDSNKHINSLAFEDLHHFIFLSQSLSKERHFDSLLKQILDVAVHLTSSDSGSIYMIQDKVDFKGRKVKKLVFKKSFLELGETEFSMPIDKKSIAGYVALTGKPIILDDVYNLPAYLSYHFNNTYDRAYNYHTKSMLVLPFINKHTREVLGVLQLINRKRDTDADLSYLQMQGDGVISYTEQDFEFAFAIACQATIAVENQLLLDEQKSFFSSFIKLIAATIDLKSKHTGAHCRRVPEIVTMLMQAVIEDQGPKFQNITFTDDNWYELQIASWLHDCGKIAIPDYVMDKATKLEAICDRIELIKIRLDSYKKSTQIQYLEEKNKLLLISDSASKKEISNKIIKLEAKYTEDIQVIDKLEEFLININFAKEFMTDEEVKTLNKIFKIKYTSHKGEVLPLITTDEYKHLSISKGTLTEEERLIINSHMVSTINILESLKLPDSLRNVPEYVSGHHERMDGKGYPRGIFAGDMSIPARVMAISDVFEALTASDRPYKKAKLLSETMSIMANMKKNNHLDPDLFDLFVTSKVYLEYAHKFLSHDLIDHIDEESLLAVKPKLFKLMTNQYRNQRKKKFLPQYQKFDVLIQNINLANLVDETT